MHAAALNEAKVEAGILQKRRGKAPGEEPKSVVKLCKKNPQVHAFNASAAGCSRHQRRCPKGLSKAGPGSASWRRRHEELTRKWHRGGARANTGGELRERGRCHSA